MICFVSVVCLGIVLLLCCCGVLIFFLVCFIHVTNATCAYFWGRRGCWCLGGGGLNFAFPNS